MTDNNTPDPSWPDPVAEPVASIPDPDFGEDADTEERWNTFKAELADDKKPRPVPVITSAPLPTFSYVGRPARIQALWAITALLALALALVAWKADSFFDWRVEMTEADVTEAAPPPAPPVADVSPQEALIAACLQLLTDTEHAYQYRECIDDLAGNLTGQTDDPPLIVDSDAVDDFEDLLEETKVDDDE